MRLLRASLVMFAAALACLAALIAANAGPLEAWGEDWQAGRAFAEHPHYQQVYAETRERTITFPVQVREDDVILAIYEARLVGAKGPVVERGVAAFYLEAERVAYVEFALLEGPELDPAMLGQAADIATTAAGIAAGFAEANPLISPTPGGLVAALAVKLGLTHAANGLGLQDCIAAKQAASGVGWGAAAWNLGMIAGGPGVALLAAALATIHTTDRESALRTCALARIAERTP